LVAGPYLLDTSTLIWAVAAPDRLSAAARKAIKAGPLVLSVVSYWEIVIKARKGLLTVSDPAGWWSRAADLLGGEILSIRATHISALAALPEIHRDPFDRMLIAQAAAEGLTLMAKDAVLHRYAVKVLW